MASGKDSDDQLTLLERLQKSLKALRAYAETTPSDDSAFDLDRLDLQQLSATDIPKVFKLMSEELRKRTAAKGNERMDTTPQPGPSSSSDLVKGNGAFVAANATAIDALLTRFTPQPAYVMLSNGVLTLSVQGITALSAVGFPITHENLAAAVYTALRQAVQKAVNYGNPFVAGTMYHAAFDLASRKIQSKYTVSDEEGENYITAAQLCAKATRAALLTHLYQHIRAVDQYQAGAALVKFLMVASKETTADVSPMAAKRLMSPGYLNTKGGATPPGLRRHCAWGAYIWTGVALDDDNGIPSRICNGEDGDGWIPVIEKDGIVLAEANYMKLLPIFASGNIVSAGASPGIQGMKRGAHEMWGIPADQRTDAIRNAAAHLMSAIGSLVTNAEAHLRYDRKTGEISAVGGRLVLARIGVGNVSTFILVTAARASMPDDALVRAATSRTHLSFQEMLTLTSEQIAALGEVVTAYNPTDFSTVYSEREFRFLPAFSVANHKLALVYLGWGAIDNFVIEFCFGPEDPDGQLWPTHNLMGMASLGNCSQGRTQNLVACVAGATRELNEVQDTAVPMARKAKLIAFHGGEAWMVKPVLSRTVSLQHHVMCVRQKVPLPQVVTTSLIREKIPLKPIYGFTANPIVSSATDGDATMLVKANVVGGSFPRAQKRRQNVPDMYPKVARQQ